MLQGIQSICITTNLWLLRNDELYIGITAGLLDPIDWSLKEALLACEKIDGKHTRENIQNAIEQIIGKFQLKQKLFVATTNNSPNEVKAIRLMEILHILCCAHTLHLSS
ncbi:2606_t:CDS:2 [Funneliformis geosporum]|uniref:2606_t:CDS:1 n=1 Tax=Funneliformis geosporum TaxID=1117311 RepID=A0A9W4SLB0_9GLOM|nr:2606_t:CDS:2 [Funneliformis geosporum]